MRLCSKLVVYLALPICAILALLGRTPTTELPSTEITAFEEASAPPTEPTENRFVEVIDLSTTLEPNQPLLAVSATSLSEDEWTPVNLSEQAQTGYEKLWGALKSGYDWGQAVVER